MGLELVKVRARTRGKTPQEFVFQGVGKVTSRPVMSDKEEQDYTEVKREDGTTEKVLLFEDKERTIPKMVKAPVRRENGSIVEVDDLDVKGLTNDLGEVANLYKSIYPSATPEQLQGYVIEGSLEYFNALQRKAASPVAIPEADDLQPWIEKFVAAGIMKAEDSAVWRRSFTTGKKQTEMETEDYIKLTREFKALAKLQPATV